MITIKLTKFVASALICSFALSYPAYAIDYSSIYDLKEETKLSNSIKYEAINKLTTSGWMKINVVRASLTDKYTETKPLYNIDGISTSMKLSEMMTQANAVAGINGDFFAIGKSTQPFGAIISDGEVITTPLAPSEKYPTISLSKDNQLDVSVWNPSISVKGSLGNTCNINFINKGLSVKYNTIILNKYYGEKSIGKSNDTDIVEIVVENNIVKEIRENKEAITIPENGYIIACASTQKNIVKNYFKVGENVELIYKFDFDKDNLKWALGGVNYLVKNGIINELHPDVLGKHPRTAVGFNKDNTEIFFVTIDGRSKNSVGATQTELAKIMIEMGAYNVINLDGGGSTTMGVTLIEGGKVEIVNAPSNGYQRPIASGLGIFNNSPKSDIIDHLELSLDHDKVFVGSKINLDIKAYNEYHSLVDIKDKNIYISSNAPGTINKTTFIPSAPGKYQITAQIGNKTITKDFDVYEKPITLDLGNDEVYLKPGEQLDFRNIIGTDALGNQAHVDYENVTWSMRNIVGTIKDGIFTAGDTNNVGAITATYKGAIKNIKIKIGYKSDTIFSFEQDDFDDLKYSSYPEKSNGSIQLSNDLFTEKNTSLKLSYDFTNMTDQSIAFVNFNEEQNGLSVSGKPLAIGMWVYGDNKNHWLRTRIEDANGKIHKIDFAEKVDWNGWKMVKAELPSNISYPIKIKNIYIAEIDEKLKDTGYIYIDNLQALYEPDDKNLNLLKDSEFVDFMKTETSQEYAHKISINNDNIHFDEKLETQIEAPLVLSFKINNNSIGYNTQNDLNEWNELKNLNKYENKNIVLNFNQNPLKLSDEREKQVFTELIENASQKNEIFIVYKSDAERLDILNGTRYIGYDDSCEIYINENSVYYKN